MQRPNLAPLVRSEAAIAQPGDTSSPSGAQAGIPGAIYTPNGDSPPRMLPQPDAHDPTASVPRARIGDSLTILDYKFTLADLNQRSYYLLHEVDESPAASLPSPLNAFRKHLRQALVLANLEICFERNWEAVRRKDDERPSDFCINVHKPCSSPSASGGRSTAAAAMAAAAAAEKHRYEENEAALGPVLHRLAPLDQPVSRNRLAQLLEEDMAAADKLLDDPACTAALRSCPGKVLQDLLQDLAYSFAAYQPAVLDEVVKGSQSPYDPRSHTKSIREVRRLVRQSMTDAVTHVPVQMAELGVRLLHAVQGAREGARAEQEVSSFALLLLQSGCQSGHSELVEKLLDARLRSVYEQDIIRRLRSAWLGYRAYPPLQPAVRVRDKAQTLDWLDFKCSCARAVIIAHKVIETVIARDDQDLTQSVQFGYGYLAATARRVARSSGGGGDAVQDSRLPSATAGAEAAAAAAQEGGDQTGADGEQTATAAGTAPPSHRADQPARALTAAGAAVPTRRPSLGAGLLDENKPAELDDKKWRIVMNLFQRPAACKPLALAMLHVVVTGKHEVNSLWRKKMEAKAEQQAQQRANGDAPQSSEDPEEEEEEDVVLDEDEAARRAAEAQMEAQREEEERARRYHKLHRLAVQACHLAVHSSSLSTVSDAISCIRAVRAWPAINLEMLNDLAAHFPQQCAQLLEAVPLKVVDMEDNVLPFGLPPGFLTVAVSEKDAEAFGQGSGSGSTQDAEHFATQREEDATIESSLLVMARTWLSLLFLFWPSEFHSPTTRKQLRVGGCVVAAFLCQGPGSAAVAAVFLVLLAVLGVLSRLVVAVFRILILGVFERLWKQLVAHVPWVGQVASRIRGGQGAAMGTGVLSGRVRPGTMVRSASVVAVDSRAGGAPDSGDATPPLGRKDVTSESRRGGRRGLDGDGGGSSSDEDSDEEGGLTAHLRRGLWGGLFAHGHNALIDGALGWGKGSASVSCRKVPFPIMYAPPRDKVLNKTYSKSRRSGRPRATQGGSSAAPASAHRQLDTALLEKLLKAPGVHPSVFGSRVLRPLILFKWDYFTKYFIILQFLLHVTYMGVFIRYAFTIKDMEPVDGRLTGPGANTPGCQLQEPTTEQTALLIVLAVMTVDFTIQELRQIRHFGLMFFSHTWDVLDLASIALVVASITLHFSCTSDVSPLTLRGLAAVQIVLLFMRLLYYAMASDKLGSFVRMVLETTYDLLMFFAFLSVVFVGFALAMIISQGQYADIEQTFIKLFTMMYGDFDVSYLSELDSGALGLDAITQVLASLYMIMVTIILLNLLISIISESYERIRENERWESLRNKAVLVVESETQLYQRFLTWLYAKLTEPAAGGGGKDGRRYLYVIAPEYARRAAPADDDDEDDDEEDDGDEEDGDDGQWNGRLGEMKRHISAQGRSTLEGLKKEFTRAVQELQVKKDVAAADTAAAPGLEAGDGGAEGGGAAGPRPVTLDEGTVQLILTQVGVIVGREIGKLQLGLLGGVPRASGQQPAGRNRLAPLTMAQKPGGAAGAAGEGRGGGSTPPVPEGGSATEAAAAAATAAAPATSPDRENAP